MDEGIHVGRASGAALGNWAPTRVQICCSSAISSTAVVAVALELADAIAVGASVAGGIEAAGGARAGLRGLRDPGGVPGARNTGATDPRPEGRAGEERDMGRTTMDPTDPMDMSSPEPMPEAPPTAAPRAAPAVAPTRAPITQQELVTGIMPPDLATGLDWVAPLDRESAKVGHLLRRTTIGVSAAELDRAMTEGYQKTVARLVDTPVAEPPALPSAENATNAAYVKLGDLQTWWVDWMVKSPTPFAEALTLF